MKIFTQKFAVVQIMVLVLVFGVACSSVFAKDSYFGIQAGAVFLGDLELVQSGLTLDTSYDTGYLVGLTLGKKIDQTRFEGELSYRNSSLSEMTFLGLSIPVDGEMTSTAIMFNGYYDIKTSSSVTPYLGAGIGFASVSIKDLKIDGTKVADDDDIVFAYQIGAGIVFDINPNTKLDLGYKYFATTDPSYSDVEGFPFDYQYSSHNLTVGLRFSF